MSRRGEGRQRGWVGALMARGTDPDPRFTFANERTFLAWIRTSLAFLAGGIGLEAFVGNEVAPPLRQVLAAGLLVIGASLALTAFRRWWRSEPLPAFAVGAVLVIAVVASAVVLVVSEL